MQNGDWTGSSKTPRKTWPQWILKGSSSGQKSWRLGFTLGSSTCLSAYQHAWFQRGSLAHVTHPHPTFGDGIGGTCPWDKTQSPAEKVLLSMCASRCEAGSLRGCVSALKAVVQLGWAPEVQWPRLWGLAKAPQETPCHKPYGGPEVLQLLGEGCKTAGGWEVYAGTVLSFSTLARVAEIASTRKSNITKMGLTFQGLKRGDREVLRRLGPYALAWSTWLRRVAPGEAPTLGSS